MTKVDALQLLRQKVSETSQAAVARAIDYRPSTISQVLSGTYPGRTDKVLEKVVEIYGGLKVVCPVLGDIPLARCAEEKRRPFAATNQQRVELWRACRTCKEKGDNP